MVKYPFCKDCKFHETATSTQPTGRANEHRVVHIPICMYWRHPVSGEPMLCEQARSDRRFCGHLGEGFEKKEDEPVKPIIETP